jgi:hypothetical protein
MSTVSFECVLIHPTKYGSSANPATKADSEGSWKPTQSLRERRPHGGSELTKNPRSNAAICIAHHGLMRCRACSDIMVYLAEYSLPLARCAFAGIGGGRQSLHSRVSLGLPVAEATCRGETGRFVGGGNDHRPALQWRHRSAHQWGNGALDSRRCQGRFGTVKVHLCSIILRNQSLPPSFCRQRRQFS